MSTAGPSTPSITPLPIFAPLPSIPRVSDPLFHETSLYASQIPSLNVPIPSLSLGPIPVFAGPEIVEPRSRPVRRRPTSDQPQASPRDVTSTQWAGSSPAEARPPSARRSSEVPYCNSESSHSTEYLYDNADAASSHTSFVSFTTPRPAPRIPAVAGPSPFSTRAISPLSATPLPLPVVESPPSPTSPKGSKPKFTNRLPRPVSVPVPADESLWPAEEEDEPQFDRRPSQPEADTLSPITPAPVPAKAIQMLGITSPADRPIPQPKKKGNKFLGSLRPPTSSSRTQPTRRRGSASLLSPVLNSPGIGFDKSGDLSLSMGQEQASEWLARDETGPASFVPVDNNVRYEVPSSPFGSALLGPSSAAYAARMANEAELLAPPASVRMSLSGPASASASAPISSSSSMAFSPPRATHVKTNSGSMPSSYHGPPSYPVETFTRPENPRKGSDSSIVSSGSSYSTASGSSAGTFPSSYERTPEFQQQGTVNRPAGVNRQSRSYSASAGARYASPPGEHDHSPHFSSYGSPPREHELPQHHRYQQHRQSQQRDPARDREAKQTTKHRPPPIVIANPQRSRPLPSVVEVGRHAPTPNPPRTATVRAPSSVGRNRATVEMKPAPTGGTLNRPNGKPSVNRGGNVSVNGRVNNASASASASPPPSDPQFVPYAQPIVSFQAMHPTQAAAALPDFLALPTAMLPDSAGPWTATPGSYGYAAGTPPTAGSTGSGDRDRPRNRRLQQVQNSPLTPNGEPGSYFEPPTPSPKAGWLGGNALKGFTKVLDNRV